MAEGESGKKTYNLVGVDLVEFMAATSNLALEWDNQLSQLSAQMGSFCELNSFRGELADSAKAYVREVHVNLLIPMLRGLIAELCDIMKLYVLDLNHVDIAPERHINDKVIREVMEQQKSAERDIDELRREMASVLSGVRDAFRAEEVTSEPYPSMREVMERLPQARRRLGRMMENADTVEETTLARLGAFGEMLGGLREARESLAAEVGAGDYRPGMAQGTRGHAGIVGVARRLVDTREGEKDEVAIARKNHDDLIESAKMHAYLRTVTALEEDMQGQVFNSFIMLVVGGAAIIASMGTATPAVVGVGAAIGGGTMVFGLNEGMQAFDTGKNLERGKLERGRNVMQDVIFQGNETAYRLTRDAFVTMSGVLTVGIGLAKWPWYGKIVVEGVVDRVIDTGIDDAMEVIALEADLDDKQVWAMVTLSVLLESSITEVAGKLAKSKMYNGALLKNSAMDESQAVSDVITDIGKSGSAPSSPRGLDDIIETRYLENGTKAGMTGDLVGMDAKTMTTTKGIASAQVRENTWMVNQAMKPGEAMNMERMVVNGSQTGMTGDLVKPDTKTMTKTRGLENVGESGKIVVNNSQRTVNDLADVKPKPRALDDVKGINDKVDYQDVLDLQEKNDIKTSYGKSTLNSLKNTENFTDSAVEHIFEGQVNDRGKAVGYHYEGIENTAGKVIPGTESSTNNLGIYQAQVEVNGITKNAHNGYSSSFFPKNMSPQEVIDSINEAYINRVYIRGNRYTGLSSSGIEIEMFLNSNDEIISAFPIYN